MVLQEFKKYYIKVLGVSIILSKPRIYKEI